LKKKKKRRGQDIALYFSQEALLKGFVSLTHMKAPKLGLYKFEVLA
jgi:hypothetical protein